MERRRAEKKKVVIDGTPNNLICYHPKHISFYLAGLSKPSLDPLCI